LVDFVSDLRGARFQRAIPAFQISAITADLRRGRVARASLLHAPTTLRVPVAAGNLAGHESTKGCGLFAVRIIFARVFTETAARIALAQILIIVGPQRSGRDDGSDGGHQECQGSRMSEPA
jgi:hypothetical protein